MRFKDKKFLVTGGTSGMGYAVVKQLSAEGARVIITGRNKSALEDTTKQLGTSVIAFESDAGSLTDKGSFSCCNN